MRAIRLHAPGGSDGLALDEIETPQLRAGEALVRVHAAAITRDELDWPSDRLPAIPSYELSGIVAAIAPGVDGMEAGDAVYALIPFDRDGAAADFVAVPAQLLAPKPQALRHVECAAIPLPALSAWQGLFDHGRLEPGERVLITGATGGRIVSIAEEPPAGSGGVYFVVEPNRVELTELTRLVVAGDLRPEIDSVFALADARAAFERSMAPGKHGKVVLRVSDD